MYTHIYIYLCIYLSIYLSICTYIYIYMYICITHSSSEQLSSKRSQALGVPAMHEIPHRRSGTKRGTKRPYRRHAGPLGDDEEDSDLHLSLASQGLRCFWPKGWWCSSNVCTYMYIYVYVCMYVRMYVYMYVWMYVCMYACMYVRTYVGR